MNVRFQSPLKTIQIGERHFTQIMDRYTKTYLPLDASRIPTKSLNSCFFVQLQLLCLLRLLLLVMIKVSEKSQDQSRPNPQHWSAVGSTPPGSSPCPTRHHQVPEMMKIPSQRKPAKNVSFKLWVKNAASISAKDAKPSSHQSLHLPPNGAA